MTHDPMCPFRPAPPGEYAPIEVAVACQCDLIAKADERGATNALNKARDLISALVCPLRECKECDQYREALACIESSRSEP